MKVLHIGKYFPPFKGGVELYLRDLMVGLEHRGVECAALVHNHRRSVSTVEDQLKTKGADFRVVRAGVLFNLAYTPISPAFRSSLARLIREFEPDAIHIHLPNPSACWILSIPAARKIPWVIHWHSDVVIEAQGGIMKMLYALYRPLEHKLLACAKAIVATSESYLSTSESLKDYPEKCHVVPLGLDPLRVRHDVEQERLPPNPQEHLDVLAIGRLAYYKGFRYLIEAVSRLENVHVHIVGKGEKERDLKKLARRLGVSGWVTFHGQLSDSELAARFASCDCVCLPSIERTEAFGLVLLEAMYFRKATVVSDVPGSGMGWVVEDGKTGLKVPPADAEALAAALKRLDADRELSQRLGENGRSKFDDLFSIDRSVKNLVKVYNTLDPKQHQAIHESN